MDKDILKFDRILFIKGVFVSILSALIVSGFRVLVGLVNEYRNALYKVVGEANSFDVVIIVFLFFLIANIISYLITVQPAAKGSGIPQVLVTMHKSYKKYKFEYSSTIIIKFFGSLGSILLGFGVGSEGPSVFMGSVTGYSLAKKKRERKFLMTIGASSGLTVLLNTPIAGLLFCVEELHTKRNKTVIFSGAIGVVVADIISKSFFGYDRFFNFGDVKIMPIEYSWLLFIFGVLIGLYSHYYKTIILYTVKITKSINTFVKINVLMVITLMLGFFYPELLGGGHHFVEDLPFSNYSSLILLLLLILKTVFTILSTSSSTPGGALVPLFAIGGLFGVLFGTLIVDITGFGSEYIVLFAILGIAGIFTSVLDIPLTGLVLVIEMTGVVDIALSVSIVGLVAYLIDSFLRGEPIYGEMCELNYDEKVH